jgi:hypothetical protein
LYQIVVQSYHERSIPTPYVLGFGILFHKYKHFRTAQKSIITGSGSVSCNLIIADNAFEQVFPSKRSGGFLQISQFPQFSVTSSPK